MRWGGAWFVPIRDNAALALEEPPRRRGLYPAPPNAARTPATVAGSGRCPRWPWGPLSDDRLIDPGADSPACRWRGGSTASACWSRAATGRDATRLSFEAGDNFWSHSHLDQGAFLIFRGPLAIDLAAVARSGLRLGTPRTTPTRASPNPVTVTDLPTTSPALLRRCQPAPLPQRWRPASHRLGLGRMAPPRRRPVAERRGPTTPAASRPI